MKSVMVQMSDTDYKDMVAHYSHEGIGGKPLVAVVAYKNEANEWVGPDRFERCPKCGTVGISKPGSYHALHCEGKV